MPGVIGPQDVLGKELDPGVQEADMGSHTQKQDLYTSGSLES